MIDLLKAGRFNDAIKLMIPKKDVAKYVKEYDNDRTLRETQVGKRKDKILPKEVVKVAKIPIPFQKKIVRTGSAFLFGSRISISSETTKIQDILNAWTLLDMDSLLLKFTEAVKSETEAAIVFFSATKNGETKIKSRLLKNENGELLPYFDEFGDLISFGWKFKGKKEGKEIEMMHLWTDEKHYVLEKSNGWIETDATKPNLFGKIPVVYYSQKYPEWWLVKELIDRFEMNLSKFSDVNDYFASPMYAVRGSIDKLPTKDETGKMVILPIVETDSGKIIEADLDVISWDRAPEALKLEFDIVKGLIYGHSDTPDLSFDEVKGLGNVSGVALELMFLAPMLKAKFDEGDYTIVVRRCLNVLMSGMSKITKKLSESDTKEVVFNIQFTSVLPDNVKEIVETLVTANGNKPIISVETAVSNNPLIQNAKEEVIRINAESKVDAFELTD